VALAVIAPIFAGVDLFDALSLDQPPTAEAGEAFNFVNDIVAQDESVAPVLIAFDYAPSYMGELHLQAESLIHHLAMRQARIMAISLTPEGAGLAQQLLDDVLSEHDGYQAGQNYVNLGYLPGEAVGIRSLEFLPQRFHGESFDGGKLKDAPIFGDDAGFTLSKVSLIVVLTGDVNDLRWWIEQTTVLEEDLPLVAGVSAAIEPQVRPYYDMESPQIDGLIIGLAGAVGYENEMDWLDGPAHLRFGGQLVGVVAVSALILIGMLVFGISRKRGKEATA